MGCKITGVLWLNSSGMAIMTQRYTSFKHLVNLATWIWFILRLAGLVVTVARLPRIMPWNVQNAKLASSCLFNNSRARRCCPIDFMCVVIMLNLQALDEIFSRLEGSGFCTGADNEDLCTAFLLMATYQGLPILAEGMIPDTWLQDQVCNQAVPGTCWTYKSDSAVWENSHDSGRVGLDI